MKKIVVLISLFISSMTPVMALDDSMTLAYTSNYVFRGLTKTEDKPAIQATYEITQSEDSGFYAGAFASNVERGNVSALEVDLYAGLRFGGGSKGRFNFDLGIIEYLYTNNNYATSSHELFFGLGTEDIYGKVFWDDTDTSYLDLGTRFNLTGQLNLDLHYGRTDTANDFGATLSLEFDSFLIAGSTTYHDATEETKTYLTVAVEIF